VDIGDVPLCITYAFLLAPETCLKLASDKRGKVDIIKNKDIIGKAGGAR
jgi:hypothetical protein